MVVESAFPIDEAKAKRSKLKTTEEHKSVISAVLYTSNLLSNLELKLKKVVSMSYVKSTFKNEIYANSSELMPYSAGKKALVKMGVKK